MTSEEHKESQRESIQNSFLSPRFKSVAAMAGWDEESLLSASLIVDDTPDRELTHKKRVVLQLKTPPSSDSRKRRRVQRSPVPIIALDLSDLGATENTTGRDEKREENEIEEDKLTEKNVSVSCSSESLLCMDKLREELSCAICLDICYEPSTTPCGHSFCLKCLRFAARKCGKKCPKCRQVISNGRSCTINTVLWNTIQLLFPQEVEAKKKSAAGDSKGCLKIQESAFYDSLRGVEDSETTIMTRQEYAMAMIDQRRIRRDARASSRAAPPAQDEDAAMALRLQREEFMGVVRSSNANRHDSQSNASNGGNSTSTRSSRRNIGSFSSARENLRAMASRATNRVRGWNF